VVVDDPSRGRQGGRDWVWGFEYHFQCVHSVTDSLQTR
jgi:hypothetical protein